MFRPGAGRHPMSVMVCLASAFLLGLCLVCINVLAEMRATARDKALNVANRLVAAIDNDIQRNIESIDLSLQAVVDGLKRPDISGVSAELRQVILFDRSTAARHLGVVLVTDADGIVRLDSRTTTPEPISAADRDYFLVHQHNDYAGLYIGRPVAGRLTGAGAIGISRRVNNPDGTFAGVAVASLRLDYFKTLFKDISLNAGSSIALTTADGVVLMRWPYDPKYIGLSLRSSKVFDNLARAPAGHFESKASTDGVWRLLVYSQIGQLPLVISVGQSLETIYAQWWHYVLILATLGAIFTAVVAFLLLYIGRQFKLRTRSELNLSTALTNMTQGLSMFDRDARLVLYNEQYLRMYGCSAETVKIGTTFHEILKLRKAFGSFDGDPEKYASELVTALKRDGTVAIRAACPDGRMISVVNRAMPNGGWVATHEDVSERSRYEKQIAHLAHHDALTGLANRMLLRERMERALSNLRRNNGSFAVFLIDLDRFKAVNDTLGHPIGDALLKEVAARLQACTREVDTVARLGGDEFAVLQIVQDDVADGAIILAMRLLESICLPYEIDGDRITIGASIGIALAPADGLDVDLLMQYADLALYKVKSDGRNNFRFFSGELAEDAMDRRAFEAELQDALAQRQFELLYQPEVELSSGRVTGAEALPRWRHPQRGLVLPEAFVPLMDESGLIAELGEWVLREACAAAVAWPTDVKVSVNVSPVQFGRGNLVDAVILALSESGLAPQRLRLEITETIALDENSENRSILNQLRNVGVGIVLDDFGTGFSSLRTVQMFPFDKIKIDKSFTADLATNPNSAAIVCAMNGLARGLKIGSLAEGIETTDQCELARFAGCEEGQGLLFGPPVPAGELTFQCPVATVRAA
ncbi:diguanylate cyclase/phosphodiesterase [Rhodoplanes sp. Z2-YC6860]|nr:diguanylate cyclase/phosphodiesterase [Rhodoplanes sp. Z2-YC6860]